MVTIRTCSFRYVLGLSLEKHHKACLEIVLQSVPPDRIHLVEANHPRAQVGVIIRIVRGLLSPHLSC